jgi:hypothetical protein
MFILKKKIFSRTSRTILIKFGINHHWVKGILNSSNKGPGPLQKGDNHENAKIWRGHLKIFLFTTRSQNSSYLHETF